MSSRIKNQPPHIRFRPPHSEYKIKEMIKVGEFDEAQAAADENVEFYRKKIEAQQELYILAQKEKMGVATDAAEYTMEDR